MDPQFLTPDQVAAIASSSRQEIIEALVAHGPQSVSSLATITGRRAKGLYFHLKALMDVDLVHIVDTRRTERRPESIFGLVEDRMRINSSSTAPGYRANADRAIETSLRQTLRQFQKYSAAVRHKEMESGRSAIARMSARLSDEAMDEVRKRMADLLDYIKTQNSMHTGDYYSVTIVALPRMDKK